MNTENGYLEFQALIADFAANYLNPVYAAKKAGNTLERPTDEAFSTIFQGFLEISSTLDALELIKKLVSLSPPKAKSVRKDDYLKFLIGSYFQEMYILEQRLTAYAKKISRMYDVPTLPGLVQRLVYQPLEKIITVRGSHVHSQRFTDKHLEALSTTALFERVGHELGEDLWFDYKLAQDHWKKQIKTNSEETLRIMDRYFNLIKHLIFADDKIVWPLLDSRRVSGTRRKGITPTPKS